MSQYVEPAPSYLADSRSVAGMDDATLGWVLVLFNSVCFVLLLYFIHATVHSSVAIKNEAQRAFADRFGLTLEAPPPRTRYRDGQEGYHLFLSHCWKHAQDVAGSAKHLLRAHYLNLRCFVDVDDLDDLERLEEHVEHSDVIVIILTKDYVTSKNCRREVKAALDLEKTIVVLRETDPNHGAATLEELRAECGEVPAKERATVEKLLTIVEDEHSCVEWYREYHLKRAALAEVMARVSALSEADAPKGSNRDSNGSARDSSILPALMSQRNRGSQGVGGTDGGDGNTAGSAGRVCLSEAYRQCFAQSGTAQESSVHDELGERFGDGGIEVLSERHKGVPVIVFLFPGCFDHEGLVSEWMQLFKSATADEVRLIPMFSTEWPFERYLRAGACHDALKDLGFFDPLYQKWPCTITLQRAAVEHAVAHTVRLGAVHTFPFARMALDFVSMLSSQKEAQPILREHYEGGPTVGTSDGTLPLQSEKRRFTSWVSGLFGGRRRTLLELSPEEDAKRAHRQSLAEAEGIDLKSRRMTRDRRESV